MTEHKPITEKVRRLMTGNFRPEKDTIANELKLRMTEHKPLGKPRRWQDELNEDIDLESWNRQGFYLAKEKDGAVEGLREELKVLLDKFGCALGDRDYTEDVAMSFQSKADKLINKWLGGKE